METDRTYVCTNTGNLVFHLPFANLGGIRGPVWRGLCPISGSL